MKEIIKFIVVAGWYVLLPPIIGYLLKGRLNYQRWAMALLVFMTSAHINKFTLMLNSVETYRGHTKGFEASLIVVLAMGMVLGYALERAKGFRWIPPGLGWWWLRG